MNTNNDFPFAQAILEQTDGGLRIIQDYYPNVNTQKKNAKFRLREDDKTASTSITQAQDGTWLVRDWGSWDKAKNAIGICMFEDGLDYIQACKKLAKIYNIVYKGEKHQAKADFSKRPRQAHEKIGTYVDFIYNENLSNQELAILGANITQDIANKYKLNSCKSFSFVKSDTEVFTFSSNEDYPILVFDYGTWQKIYQPKAEDKKNRFRYAGAKPTNFIFGLDEIKRKHQILVKKALEEYDVDDEKTDIDPKLDEIIICSGDKDALNMASFGYNVVWLNSETASLTWENYKLFKSYANTIYNLPDIDTTGVKQAVDLAMKFIEIKTIWLPNYLRFKRDFRGNKCKDVSDFVKHFYKPKGKSRKFVQLKKLVQNALPMKFWDEHYDKKKNEIKYYFNIVHSHHFLKHNGFYRYETPNEKEDYCYIHIDGNIVKRTTPNKIENFVNNFLVQRQFPVALKNMVLKTPYLKESTLSKLPLKEIDFIDTEKEKQFWFFNNFSLEITAQGMKLHKPGDLKKYVWEDKIISHNANYRTFLQTPQFKIFKDKDGDLDIEILKTDSKYFNYLINTSRIHWKKDLEESFKGKPAKLEEAYFKENQFNIAGPNLNPDEILEQKLHLINKIYALGYLLHKFKNKSKGWFVFAMDNKLSDVGESHGGSGKSLALDYLKVVLKKQAYVAGRNKKATQNDFFYDGVTKETDYVFVDDMNQYFDFQFLFSDITGSMRVNPKNGTPFTLEFENSPKLAGTSNFPPRDLDPSTSRRILFMVFSDYYHHYDNVYKQARKVSDDFGGKNLFDNFTPADYDDVLNFWAQCIQFYLATPEKIEPPMNNVNKRNLLSIMGAQFYDWVLSYFSKEANRLDTYVSREASYKHFQKTTSSKLSSNRFKKALTAYCELKGYVLNPKDLCNSEGRIIKRMPDERNEVKSMEAFYIKSIPTAVIEHTENSEDITNDDELAF